MVNAIAIMILIVVATRIYKIYKNGGVTDIRTEVLHAGTHFVLAFVMFAVFMMITSV